MYRRQDGYYRRAKMAGFRSRAAYKLLELNRRHRLIRRGDRVLDLGAWPGGWMQVAAEAVGPNGCVVGVDVEPVAPLPQRWARSIVGTVTDENVRGELAAALAGMADVVLSDMAPKLSGIRARDEARATELAAVALDLCRRALRPGGRLLVKVFDGEATQAMISELRQAFDEVKTTRPEATRKGSSELYVLAVGFRSAG